MLDESDRAPQLRSGFAKDRALVVAEPSSSEGIATPEEAEAAWREEIARRAKSLEDGTAVLHDWNKSNEEISFILKGA